MTNKQAIKQRLVLQSFASYLLSSRCSESPKQIRQQIRQSQQSHILILLYSTGTCCQSSKTRLQGARLRSKTFVFELCLASFQDTKPEPGAAKHDKCLAKTELIPLAHTAIIQKVDYRERTISKFSQSHPANSFSFELSPQTDRSRG